MVTHSFYESDNRIIRYAEALAERGDQVEVVALRRSSQLPKRELVNGVVVHRIQDRFGKDEGSPWSYLWPILRFCIVSSKWLVTVKFFNPLSLRAIARVMADADLGGVPKRPDSFGNEAYSTKIIEFMSLGVPVVVSGTRVGPHYFDESVARFFESGNGEELARAMYEVLTDLQLRESMIRNANEYMARDSWGRHKSGYLQLVDTLIAPQSDAKKSMRPV
jgi:glycosyltransferase involved in cell wall biosynthesis